jgi:hypothetical protein
MFVLTQDLHWAYWLESSKIKSSSLIEVPNREVRQNEYFYDVPKNLWQLVDLTELF